MALTTLDQDISRKAAAMRSMDPSVAAQKAKQSDDFLGLIALQKLKSEKDAAQREMAMKMQQQPGTIKQQREAELLQRNKDELMKQTAGIMQMAQQREQQNLQRAAKGMPTAPGMGGLAQNIRPQIARMAAGGIVGYQEGRSVEDVDAEDNRKYTEAEIRAFMEQLRSENPRAFANITPEQAIEIVEARSAPSFSLPTPSERGYGGDPRTGKYMPLADVRGQTPRDGQLTLMNAVIPDNAPTPTPAPAPTGPFPSEGFDAGAMMARKAPEDQKPSPPTGTGTGVPSAGLPLIKAQKPDFSNVGNRAKETLGAMGLGTPRDPQAAMKSARDDAYKYVLGDTEKQYADLMGKTEERYKSMEERLAELQARQSDPEKLARDRWRAFTIGAGRSGVGGGVSGLRSFDVARDARERADLKQILDLEKEGLKAFREDTKGLMGAQREARTEGQRAGNLAMQSALADRRTVAEVKSRYDVAEIKAAENIVKNQLEADKANLRAQLDKLRIDAQNALNKAIKDQESQTRLSARLDVLTENKNKYIKSIIDNDLVLIQMKAAEAKATKEGDTKEAQQIRRDINKREDLLRTGALSSLNEEGWLDMYDQLLVRAGFRVPSYGGLRKVDAAEQAVERANKN